MSSVSDVVVPLTFPVYRGIRSVFQCEELVEGSGVGGSSRVVQRYRVYRVGEDGVEVTVFEFERRGFLGSAQIFEPFQQYQGGVWHPYALISLEYTTFSVLDLVSGEVVATRGYRVHTQEMFDEEVRKYGKSFHEVGYEYKSSGFCPLWFNVFDFYDTYWGEREEVVPGGLVAGTRWEKDYLRILASLNGSWGLVGGCVWGDDTVAKLRHIDLGQVSGGSVVEDERYGYFECDGREMLQFYGDECVFRVETPVMVNPRSGKVLHSGLNVAADYGDFEA